jgi:hypothetical protein
MILIAVLVLFAIVAEEPEQVAIAVPGETAGPIIFSIASPPELADWSLGMTILVQDLLARNSRSVIGCEDAEKSLRSAKIWRPDRAILVKDIPYLASVFNASVFIQGWLEEDMEGWQLHLRLYDVFTGGNKDSINLSGKPGDIQWFIENSAAAIARWLHADSFVEKPDRWLSNENEAFRLAGLYHADAPFDDETLTQLADLLGSFPYSPKRYSSFLKASWIKKISADENSSSLAQAVLVDLSGDDEQAIKRYTSIGKNKTGYGAAQVRAADLLRHIGQPDKASKLLKNIKSYNSKTVAVSLAMIQDALAAERIRIVETELEKLNPEDARPELYLALAAAQAKAGQNTKQATTLAHAAECAFAQKMYSLATRIASDLVAVDPYAINLDWLDTRYLSNPTRVALVQHLAGGQPTRRSLLAVAELLKTDVTSKAAAAFYDRAVMIEPFDADAFAKAGEYFAAHAAPERKVNLYLKAALVVQPDHPRATRALATVFKKAGQCADGLKLASSWASRHASWPAGARYLAGYYLECKDQRAAEALIDARLDDFPDDIHMLVLKIKADMLNESMIEAQLHYAHLKAVDVKLAERLGPPEVKTVEVKLKAPDGDREDGESLLGAHTAGPNKGGAYDDLQGLQDELAEKLAGSEIKVDLAGLAEMIEEAPPGELEVIMGQLGVQTNVKSAQTQLQKLFIVNSGSKSMLPRSAGPSLMSILKDLAESAQKRKEAQEAAEQAETNKSRLPKFTSLFDFSSSAGIKISILFIGLLFLLACLLLLVYLIRRIKGKGALSVKVLYNRSFHAGFFVGRLSKKEMETAFGNIERVTKSTRRSDTGWYHSFVSVLLPYKTIAVHDTLNFRHIPPGDYHLTVASIQIDVKTGFPIGSLEVHKRVHIDEGQHGETIRFDEEGAYIGVLVESLIGNAASADGGIGNLKKGVTITIEGGTHQEEHGQVNEEISFSLPPGDYTIKAVSGSVSFKQKVSVSPDMRPQWVKFRLDDKTSGVSEKPSLVK